MSSALPEDDRTSSAQTVDLQDPLEHLKVIAGPEMDGRGTPSPGLDKAVDYVIAECVKAGLEGGLGSSLFKQPFTVSGQTVNNVVALLPGTGPRANEIIFLSAHLDHLGHGFPGADDNGSGSAALLAIANRLVAEKAEHPLDRTVGFLWTVGEEKGLLGSKYFTSHPPPRVPLTSIAQEINLDAIGALEDWRLSTLPDTHAHTRVTEGLIESIADEMQFTRINHDLQAYTQRTDAASFVNKQVPTVWVFEGLSRPEGGGPLMPRYHKGTDTVDNMLADNGGRKIRRMTTMLGTLVQRLSVTTF